MSKKRKRNIIQNICYGLYLFICWIIKTIKSIKFSKVIVIGVILLNIWFTLRIFDLVERTGVEPGYLVGAWFGFTTVELWSLSTITKNKDKISANKDDEYLGG